MRKEAVLICVPGSGQEALKRDNGGARQNGENYSIGEATKDGR